MSIITHYNSLADKTHNNNCDVFRAAALDTWKRIGFSRTTPMLRIFETTITQNIIYELNLLKASNSAFNFRIFESTNEKANGDDLEISIKNLNGQYFTFAVQAKIIYHTLPSTSGLKDVSDGFYPQIKHRGQIDLLIRFAKRKKFLPLYLLYNYVGMPLFQFSQCDIDYDITQHGCSIVSAHYLRKKYKSRTTGIMSDKIKYSDLHPNVALPWFVLPCCFSSYSSTQEVVTALGIKEEIKFQFQNADELIDDNEWIAIRGLNEKEMITQIQVIDSDNATGQFIPKFKIVLD